MVSTVEPATSGDLLSVVVIDPRPARRQLVRHLVESTGVVTAEIGEAADADEAVALLGDNGPDVAVVEIQMPIPRGLETIAALRKASSAVRIVVCSFERNAAVKAQALDEGADAYLDKPVSSVALKALLRGFFPERSLAE